WKAYKQAKGGDAWLVTVTWADFKKLFILQFFPRAEQERLKREYHSIRQTSIGVVIGTSRPPSRVVTGVTVRITTVTNLTGVVEMTTTA
nr:zinc finger, CCHC-type, retrotransposon Gag domain protein [Tanacetum cinerariifolium]